MTKAELIHQIKMKKSLLCIGLDTDITRIPKFIKENYDDPILEFNRRIIAATKDHCVAYKFNIAFYESQGPAGWESLEKSLSLVGEDHFTIADAKRGDIGNTSKLYARTFFEYYNFDSITVSPYMGRDSLEPFYSYDGKWVIILGLTSNVGSQDVQMLPLETGEPVYKQVIKTVSKYGTPENTMFVVGATRGEQIEEVRSLLPDHFFLMPGIGKQGGDLDEAMKYGKNEDYGLLINSSRGIIFAGEGTNFDQASAEVASTLQEEISKRLV